MLIKRRQSKDILSLATIYWQQLSKYLMSRAMTFIQSEIDEILSFHCISFQDFSRRPFSTSLCPCLFVQWCRRENRGAGLIKIKRQETLYNVNSVYYILLGLYGENLYYIAKSFHLFSTFLFLFWYCCYALILLPNYDYLFIGAFIYFYFFFYLSFCVCIPFVAGQLIDETSPATLLSLSFLFFFYSPANGPT